MRIYCKLAALLAAVFLALPFPAWGEEEPFWISENAVITGMGRSWRQGYEPLVSANTLSLILPLASNRAQGSIQAEFRLKDDSLSLLKSSAVRAVKVNKGENGLWVARFSLDLLPDRQNGDYACLIRLRGEDGAGKALLQDIPLTLRIRDGRPSKEELALKMDRVQAELKVGEDGQISAWIKNPCRAAKLENLQWSFSEPSGHILPQFESLLRLGDLEPGEEREIVFPVTVLGTAAVTPHVVAFTFSFTALDQPVTQTEAYTLHITQEMRLEHGGLRMADSAVAGDSVTMTLPLMNLGKADLMNVICSLSLPGITDRQAVLVGSIGPGETKQGQLSVLVPKEARGEYEGVLSVEAADNDGNRTSLSLPVHLTAEAPAAVPNAAESQKKAEEKPPLLLYGLGGGCGVMLLLFVLQGALLRRKIRRLEEEKM